MEPIRSCIVCRKRQNKSDIIRIVSDKNLNAIYDRDQKYNSRGIYLCKDPKCIKKLIKALDKNRIILKINVDKDNLRRVLEDVENELGE